VQPGSPNSSAPDLVEALVARVDEIDAQLRATTAAIDEKSLKEFRRTVEALSKRDAKFEERLANKVDVVVDRIETVARTVSTTSAALAAKDGEIAQLQRELDAGSARVDSALAEVRRGLDPAALNEVKRTLAELSKQKLPRGLESRIDELGTKLAILAQRIDTVSSTVSTAAAGLAGRDGDVIALRRTYEAETARVDADLADLRRAIDPTPVVDLRQAVKELSDAAFGQKRSNQRQLDAVGAKIDALVGQLDSFSTSVTSTATRVSGSEEEISALRAYAEDGRTRVNSFVLELRQAVAALSAQSAALEEAEGEAARVLDERVSGVSGSVDDLADRLDSTAASQSSTAARVSATEEQVSTLRGHVKNSGVHLNSLAATVAAATERLDARDVELETLERRFHDATMRVDGLVAELTRALAELPDPASTEQLLDARLSELDRSRVADRVRVEELADRLEAVATSVESMAGRAPETGALERGIDELVERVDAAAEERRETSSEVARLAAILEVERAAVRSRLESLAASQESAIGAVSAEELERRVVGFDSRVEAIEHAREALAARIGRLTSAFDTERASFQTQLEALATALSWTSPKSPVDERLDALDKRMEGLERQSTAVASKVSQATMLLPTALRSLEARLDERAPGTRSMTGMEYVAPLQPAPRNLESSTDVADYEPDEDETPHRLPTPVVPIRGTDS
jgi:chromosome segregation ATPase